MGLALGVRLQGSVFVEDTRFSVTKINEDKSFRLTGGNVDYKIGFEKPGIEIYPNVMAYADINSNHGKDMVLLVLEAPKEIPILRGKLYWQEKENLEIEVDDDKKT